MGENSCGVELSRKRNEWVYEYPLMNSPTPITSTKAMITKIESPMLFSPDHSINANKTIIIPFLINVKIGDVFMKLRWPKHPQS